jgi:hypothetical protein
MILPGKHLRADRSLITLGGDIIGLLDQPKSVTEVWSRFKAARAARSDAAPVTYDWFVLALTFLNAIHAVRLDGNMLTREGVT